MNKNRNSSIGDLNCCQKSELQKKEWGIMTKKQPDHGRRILYEDQDLLVCVKPAGIAAQTKKSGQQDMVSLLRNYRHANGEEPYIGLVHRLDQPVEGILVFGKHAGSTAALSRQLTQGTFAKGYLAVAQGTMPAREGKLVDFLKKDGRANCSYVVGEKEPGAKRAELLYQVLETDASLHPARNLVKIQLLTGRHHQIRAQMAHVGTPLAGDCKYGIQSEAAGCCQEGLGLCAFELVFVHPVLKKKMKFEITPSQPVFQKFAAVQISH